ncbi:hypothetical protein BDQ17DRAFT_1422396 [Cyathus striatus]|nr:hypothetical protein BDQ17DRAFT_1422396 [Cyathus striatus]
MRNLKKILEERNDEQLQITVVLYDGTNKDSNNELKDIHSPPFKVQKGSSLDSLLFYHQNKFAGTRYKAVASKLHIYKCDAKSPLNVCELKQPMKPLSLDYKIEKTCQLHALGDRTPPIELWSKELADSPRIIRNLYQLRGRREFIIKNEIGVLDVLHQNIAYKLVNNREHLWWIKDENHGRWKEQKKIWETLKEMARSKVIVSISDEEPVEETLDNNGDEGATLSSTPQPVFPEPSGPVKMPQPSTSQPAFPQQSDSNPHPEMPQPSPAIPQPSPTIPQPSTSQPVFPQQSDSDPHPAIPQPTPPMPQPSTSQLAFPEPSVQTPPAAIHQLSIAEDNNPTSSLSHGMSSSAIPENLSYADMSNQSHIVVVQAEITVTNTDPSNLTVSPALKSYQGELLGHPLSSQEVRNENSGTSSKPPARFAPVPAPIPIPTPEPPGKAAKKKSWFTRIVQKVETVMEKLIG